jgi:phage baseplate assembly protein W
MQKRPTPASLKKITNRDFDLQFRRHPTTGKLLMKKDDDAVKQALKNLILTNKYERPFRINYGGNIRARLFDLYTSTTKDDFTNLIETTIQNYEPRVKLLHGGVSVTEVIDQNALVVTIRFQNVLTLNQLTLDINLNRVR